MVENANKDDRSEQGNGKAQDCEQEKDIETPPIDAQAIEFECGLCNFKSKTKNVLEGHIRFDHLKCQTCKENFFTIEKFKSHMEKSHTDSIWHKKKNCELCKRSFSNWTLYEAHIKSISASISPAQIVKKRLSQRQLQLNITKIV